MQVVLARRYVDALEGATTRPRRINPPPPLQSILTSSQWRQRVMSDCGLFPASLSEDFIRHEWLLQIAGF